jgi:hypothetical protein
MYGRRTAAAAVLLASCGMVAGAASPAAAVCDAYSGGCPTSPPDAPGGGVPIAGTPQDPASGTPLPPVRQVSTPLSTPSTLPFTGGELVLMTAVGAGVLAGGTALVIAGRRRSQPAQSGSAGR